MADPSPSSDAAFTGFMGLTSGSSELNALNFVVQMALSKLWTATVVRVVSSTNAGDVAPPGQVDVTPLVAMVNGIGDILPHGVIYRLPIMRLQSGATAIILDPQEGDIGVVVFASRDISAVKATLEDSPPGSARTFDPADGMYLATILSNVTPTQFIQFQGGAINMQATTNIAIKAPAITLDGAVSVTGAVTAASTIVAAGNVTGAGVSLSTHRHSGVQTGGSNTGMPV